MTLRFIDLFAGIGGIRKGFESIGWKCVFTSELDKYARATYEANFLKDHQIQPDVTKIVIDDLPEFEAIMAGFPCQPFSLAGKLRGFEDTRGTLFRNIVEITARREPRFVFLENVRNLQSHDGGNTFKVIEKSFKDLGYTVKSTILNAKDFGISQSRSRFYIVCFKEVEDAALFQWPAPTGESTSLKTVLRPDPNDKYNNLSDYVISNRQWESTQARELRPGLGKTGFPGSYKLVNENSEHTSTLIAGYSRDHTQILVDRSGPNDPLEKTPYTDSGKIEKLKNSANPRRVTPRECARLQGFEDTFVIPVSDMQAYKQFGNSVAIPVIKAIARELAKCV